MPRASISSGYSVPSSTLAVPTTSSTLFISSRVSRDSMAKFPPGETFGARQANSSSELPTTSTSNARMKMPRRGSVAKA
jgi:hypothetical protein